MTIVRPAASVLSMLVALGVSLVSTLAFVPDATAALEDEPTFITVSGVLVPTAAFSPQAIYFCEEACLTGLDVPADATGARVGKDGSFTTNVDPAASPRIAVVFETFEYLGDGSKTTVDDAGYLRTVDGTLEVSGSFESSDTWVMEEDLGDIEVTVPEPEKPLPVVAANFTFEYGNVYGNILDLGYTASKIQKGTTIVVKVYGCQSKVVTKKVIRKRTGTFPFSFTTKTDNLARRVPLTFVARKKGHANYVLQESVSPINGRPKKC